MPNITQPGRHAVKVIAADFGESEKGTPFLQLGFETEAGEHISGWLYLSDAAFNNTLKTLRDAFGFDGVFDNVVAQVQGKPCSITCELEEYDGKERLKVKWINRPSTAKPIEDKGAFLKSLTAKAARVPVVAAKVAPKAAVKVTKADEPF